MRKIGTLPKNAKEYINKYTDPIKIDGIQNYKWRMIRTYPFHLRCLVLLPLRELLP